MLVAGLSLAAAGLAFGTTFFLAAGGVIFLVGLIGWIVQLLPGRGHVHLEVVEPLPSPVTVTLGAVQRLVGHARLTASSCRRKSIPFPQAFGEALVGGALMPIPALLYGLLSGHGIWYPVNLLAGMALPGVASMNLDQFHPSLFIAAIFIHVAMSLSIGLMLGVLLPTLPPVPKFFAWGGLLMPLLWSAVTYVLMRFSIPCLKNTWNGPGSSRLNSSSESGRRP